jgi:cyclopropane-fatty-acyl-phospholipid synthase
MTDLSCEFRGEGLRVGFWQRQVLRALEKMPHGRLAMTLPDGAHRSFGTGSNPRQSRHGLSASMHVRSDGFFRRCVLHGDIGFAESFLAGEWDSPDLAEVISWFILNAETSPAQSSSRLRRSAINALGWVNRLAHRLRANTVDGSRENIAAHYDLSNAFFASFLDPSMTYSSALFAGGQETLEEAQNAKYDRLCRLLELKPGQRILEIGGGWGAFARRAARLHGCHVTSVTVSQQQYFHAARLRHEQGLEQAIDLRLADYRTLSGTWDRIVSIEMLEAVGHEFLDTFFARCHELLAPNGLAALQVITAPDSRYERVRRSVDFIQKHIFPGGQILSVGAIVDSLRRVSDLQLHDLHDLGDSYAKTLELWLEAFERGVEGVKQMGFDEVFVRKWRYYLVYCMAAFRMRHVSVVQMLLTRPGNHALGIAR